MPPINTIRSWEKNRHTNRAVLQNAQTVADLGQWAPVEGVHPVTVTIGGTFTGLQVVILVSNNELPPADSDVSWGIWGGIVYAAPAIVVIDAPIRYLKAQVQAIASGSVTVAFMAAERSTD